MAVGLATAQAHSWLNTLRNTASPAIATVFVKLHTGDPGSAGANAASGLTTRNQLTLNAPSAGSCTLGTLAAYTMNTTETISHVSLWDASTAGNFLGSGALSVAKPVNASDTLTFTTFTVSVTPLAA